MGAQSREAAQGAHETLPGRNVATRGQRYRSGHVAPTVRARFDRRLLRCARRLVVGMTRSTYSWALRPELLQLARGRRQVTVGNAKTGDLTRASNYRHLLEWTLVMSVSLMDDAEQRHDDRDAAQAGCGEDTAGLPVYCWAGPATTPAHQHSTGDQAMLRQAREPARRTQGSILAGVDGQAYGEVISWGRAGPPRGPRRTDRRGRRADGFGRASRRVGQRRSARADDDVRLVERRRGFRSGRTAGTPAISSTGCQIECLSTRRAYLAARRARRGPAVMDCWRASRRDTPSAVMGWARW